MLKSSISFTDKENIQLGKYTLKIFIEGQEEAICEQFFEILEKEPIEVEEDSQEVEEINEDSNENKKEENSKESKTNKDKKND